MTRRDQEERIDAPLADLRENQIDERHESWKSMHFESHKTATGFGGRTKYCKLFLAARGCIEIATPP